MRQGGTDWKAAPLELPDLEAGLRRVGERYSRPQGKECPQADFFRRAVHGRRRKRRPALPAIYAAQAPAYVEKEESPAEPGHVRRASRVRMRGNIGKINLCV